MKMLKNYKHVLDFWALEDSFILLKEDDKYSLVYSFHLSSQEVKWKTKIDKSKRLFVHKDKIFITTIEAPQRTMVLNSETGENVNNEIPLIIHLPVFKQINNKVVAFINYEKNDIFSFLDLDSFEVVELNPNKTEVNLIIDQHIFLKKKRNNLLAFHANTSLEVWNINLEKALQVKGSATPKFRIVTHEVFGGNLILSISDLRNSESFLTAFSLQTGQVIWSKTGYNNVQLYNDTLIDIGFYGLFRNITPSTGEVTFEKDLRSEFHHWDITCEYRFLVTKSHIVFKDGSKGKIGIFSRTLQTITDVIQLPDGITIGVDDIPYVRDDLIFIKCSSYEEDFFLLKTKEIFQT